MERVQRISQDMVQDCLDVVPSTDYIIVPATPGRIDDFVEKVTMKPYIKGTAFYQLTKKVLVQKSKQIYIYDKETKNVYQGSLARSLLGLPDQNCHVTPVYNGRYDIFIQSTSLNRKLEPGTNVLILR